jgi:hypothetical protein
MLGGVIFQDPSTSDDPNQAIAGLEIIRARPAHFIMPNGRLDHARWERLQWWSGVKRGYTTKEKAKITAGTVAALVITGWVVVLAIAFLSARWNGGR